MTLWLAERRPGSTGQVGSKNLFPRSSTTFLRGLFLSEGDRTVIFLGAWSGLSQRFSMPCVLCVQRLLPSEASTWNRISWAPSAIRLYQVSMESNHFSFSSPENRWETKTIVCSTHVVNYQQSKVGSCHSLSPVFRNSQCLRTPCLRQGANKTANSLSCRAHDCICPYTLVYKQTSKQSLLTYIISGKPWSLQEKLLFKWIITQSKSLNNPYLPRVWLASPLSCFL